MKTGPQSEEARKRIGDAVRAYHKKNPGFTDSNLKRYKTGDKMPEEIRRRISAARKRHAALFLPECQCILHKKVQKSQTKIEILLVEKVLAGFSEVIVQEKFGPYTVDAYLPKYHLAFEADGEYWHSMLGRKEHDEERDRFLMENFSLPVIHLSGKEILNWN